MGLGKLVGKAANALRATKRTAKRAATRARSKERGGITPLEKTKPAKASGEDSTSSGILGTLPQWARFVGVAGMSMVVSKMIDRGETPPREELLAALKIMQADQDSSGEVATGNIAGLDRQMLLMREAQAQAPAGTPPGTPILDRLQVLNPNLLSTLRLRLKGASGGLWSELAEGEVLVDGASAPSRAQKAAEDQQLEVTLREELGFTAPGAPTGPRQGRDAQALLA